MVLLFSNEPLPCQCVCREMTVPVANDDVRASVFAENRTRLSPAMTRALDQLHIIES